MCTLPTDLLASVLGGADLNAIKDQARPYCPDTVAKYDQVDPSTIDRTAALAMGTECVAEIKQKKGGFVAGIASGRIQKGIDAAFPQ